MTQNDLNYVLKYFTKCDEDFDASYYFHNEEYFHIVVYNELRNVINNNSVYQIDSEGVSCGLELETLEDLKIRFKSFTGKDLECVTE